MSGKHCGPSKGLLDLDAKIGSAMDDLQNSSIGTAAAGIADSISGLKDNLKSKTDGILEKIEAAVPEIPEPKASLQAQMTNFINNLDNPGAALQELEDIKENFGSNINIDEMLAKTGVDPEKMKSLSEEFKALQEKAKLQNAVGSLADLAAGDLSAVKDLMGGLPSVTLPGFDTASIIDGICKDVPNAEIDADGDFVEKGTESKVASEDAESSIEKSETNNAPKPEKQAAPADNLENSNNIILNPDTDEAQKIEEEYTERLQELSPLVGENLKKQAEAQAIKEKIDSYSWDRLFYTSTGGVKKQQELRPKYISLVRETSSRAEYLILALKDADYERKLKLFNAGLIKKEPDKLTITWTEIHEKTFFQQYTEDVDLIMALPNLVIKGIRPPRENLEMDEKGFMPDLADADIEFTIVDD